MKQSVISLIKTNLKSGITVGLLSMPISISLATASHASPTSGIITAIWAGFIASLFGGSNYNIIGPTASLTGLLIVNAVTFGAECLPMLAILSGIFIFIAYLFSCERYLIFIPGSTLHGVIMAVASMIFCNQIAPALGLSHLSAQKNFFERTYQSLSQIHLIHWPSFTIFICSFIGLLLFARFSPRFPGTIVLTPLGILIGYLSTEGYYTLNLQTLGVNYPSMEASLFSFPSFHFDQAYLFPALAIATVSILETMVSARIADGITRTKHNKRKELLALSLANIACGLAGGIPATAALARTSINIKSGCSHKISATLSSICTALSTVLFLSYFYYLPLAVVAAILVFVAGRMLEMEHLLRLFRIDKKNFALSIFVAFISLYENVTIGILLGIVISMLIFMEKLSTGYHEIMVKQKDSTPTTLYPYEPTYSTFIYSIKGPLAYINAQAHIARLEKIPPNYSNVVLDLEDVHFIDPDGAEALSDIITLLSNKKMLVYLVGLNPVIELLVEENSIVKLLKKNNRIFSRTENVLSSLD